MWVFIWIALAIVCGIAGKNRSCGGCLALILGFICPLLGLVVILLSSKNKTAAEALIEAEVLFRNGVISAGTYDEMRTDIINGKIKDPKHYSDKSVINPFRR